MSVKVEQVLEPLAPESAPGLGEGPHWDERQQALFFVGVFMNTIHKYVPSTGVHTRTKLDKDPHFIIPVDGETDSFVLGIQRKIVLIRWDGQDGSPATVVKELGEVDQDKPTSIINDGKVDPTGRFLFTGTYGYEMGTFTKNQGSLYRYDGRVTKVDERISLSNGMAWDLQQKAFYYVDSFENNIRKYDYDVTTGTVSNRQHIFDFKANNIAEGSIPDGMTIDTEGNLWVAVFGGSCVLNIDPRTGKLLRKVDIPAKQVTSVTFGGPDLDVLFVTTGSFKYLEEKPSGGSVYTVTGLGVKGYPNIRLKL